MFFSLHPYIACDFYFSHSVCSFDPSFKMVYSILLQCKVTLFFFVINDYFIEKYLEIV